MAITISGGGTITGIVAGGLPDGTVQQADLAANVAGNGPAFSVSTTTSSYNSSGNSTVIFTTKDFDTANAYSTVTGKFQPTVSGYYQFNASIAWGSTTAIAGKVVTLVKNTASFGVMAFSTSDTGPWETTALSGMCFLNGTTDFVSVLVATSSGSGSLNGGSFQGFLARAA